jgi:hypothetical protein
MTIQLALVDGRMREEISTDHLSSDHVAAFLDGRLTGAERERAVRHFAGCSECREELTEVRDVLAGATSRPRRWVVPAVAAAAIVAFVTIPRIMGVVGGDPVERVRAEQSTPFSVGINAIPVLSPADQASVPQTGVELSWRSAGYGATYTITVQDSSGNEVWRRTSLADTSATVPDSVGFRPGSLYFWSVDARLIDGNTAKTGPHTFFVR